MVVYQLLLWKASIQNYENLPWLLISHSSTYQKYHCIDILSKDFDGLSILIQKCLHNNLQKTTMASSRPQMHLPRYNTKGGLTNGGKDKANLN